MRVQSFDDAIADAAVTLAKGEPLLAAVKIQSAALRAWRRHPGFFRSARAERALETISRSSIPATGTLRSPSDGPKRILHVVTELYLTGGHTRAIQRWMEADNENRHSVAITQQLSPIADDFAAAARATGGQVFFLDRFAKILKVAKRLRELAADFDLVVLSAHPHDVVPILAFAGDDARPPIALFNHADHVFWLGESIADLLIGFRDSGNRLARARRGFGSERISLLPLPLRSSNRSALPNRIEARRRLGLPENGRIVLTVASPYKLAPNSRADYFELHRPMFETDHAFRMILVGPGADAPYLEKIAPIAGDRMHAVGIQMDLSLYHAAADVYVDSTPFASQTSLLEAAAAGLPCLSWRPYPPDQLSAVLGSDDPSYLGCNIVFNDPADYRRQLSELLSDPGRASAAGSSLATAVGKAHWGPRWLTSLRDVYGRAAENARNRPHSVAPDEGRSEVDDDILAFQSASMDFGDDPYKLCLPFLPLRRQLDAFFRPNDDYRPTLRDFLPSFMVRMIRTTKSKDGRPFRAH